MLWLTLPRLVWRHQEAFTMRWLYRISPSRPLSDIGRVLLGLVTAVAATLVLVAWTAVPADELDPATAHTTHAHESSVH
jgi:hypothetical protein